MASHNSHSYKETQTTFTMTSTPKVIPFLTILSLILLPLATPEDVNNDAPATDTPEDDGTSAGSGGTRSIEQLNKEFLELHNEVRAEYQMPPLTWDKKLEDYARNYAAQQSQKDCEFKHSQGSGYGECLFLGYDAAWTPKTVIDMFVDERKDFNFETNKCNEGKVCGHFTQVVWKETKRVGCSFAECPNQKAFFVGCNYEPPGNYEDKTPFEDGNSDASTP